MEESVWTFEHVTLRHRRYLVLLVRWSDFDEPVSTELEGSAQQFGEYMEGNGVLVMPYRQKMRDAFRELLAKDWPDQLQQRMKDTQFPFLVIIDKDFKDFVPKRDRSAIVWFADFEEKPGEVWKVLDAIARKVQIGDDLFDYLEQVEARARRSRYAKQAEGVAKYVDVTIPIAPGFVSVKAGAIWADAMKLLQCPKSVR